MALSPEDARTLAAVLDEIIPPSDDGRLPGAGEVGLVAHIEAVVERSPDLRPAVEQGLAALRSRADGAGAAFEALDAEARAEILAALATEQPAFLPALVFQTFAGYYQQGSVLEALGLEPRPPHPKGHALELGDLSLLDPVRARGRRYRET